MEQSPINKYSRGFLTLVAILLMFVLLLVAIWLWYDLRLASLERAGKDSEASSTHIIP